MKYRFGIYYKVYCSQPAITGYFPTTARNFAEAEKAAYLQLTTTYADEVLITEMTRERRLDNGKK